jgi:hypothetical protein
VLAGPQTLTCSACGLKWDIYSNVWIDPDGWVCNYHSVFKDTGLPVYPEHYSPLPAQPVPAVQPPQAVPQAASGRPPQGAAADATPRAPTNGKPRLTAAEARALLREA